jgi:copper(I)-binding protein
MQIKIFGILGAVLLVLSGGLVACGTPAGPSLEAEEVWARPALTMKESGESSGESMGMGQPMPGTGAVFMRLKNVGGEPDRLTGGQTDVAEVVEIHESIMEGDVMKMRMLPEGLAVPAKGEVLLKPGGYHVMLIGIKRDLVMGDTFALDLEFEKSGTVTVQPEVREP